MAYGTKNVEIHVEKPINDEVRAQQKETNKKLLTIFAKAITDAIKIILK